MTTNPTLNAILVGIFLFGFGLSFGPITWIYVADILPDIGMGICVANLWIFTLIVASGITTL